MDGTAFPPDCRLVLTPLGAAGTAGAAYLPKVAFIAVIVLFTRYLLKVIRLLFRAIGSGGLTLEGFEREWARRAVVPTPRAHAEIMAQEMKGARTNPGSARAERPDNC